MDKTTASHRLPAREFVTVLEIHAAQILPRSLSALYRMVKKGTIPRELVVKLGKAGIAIRRDAFLEWLNLPE